MRKLQIILLFGLFTNYLSAQDFNGQIRRLKLMMLPETSFRFPCGDSLGHGYYIATHFQQENSNGKHLGIDVSGIGGGNSDLGDTIYSIGHGIVALAEDYDLSYLSVYYKFAGHIVKAIYYHCDTILCKTGQLVPKGYPIATIGNRGTYLAHLHLEIASDTCITLGGYGEPESFIDPEHLLPFYKNK